jgi:hypothetical protein
MLLVSDGLPAAPLDDPLPVRNQLPLSLPFLEQSPRSAYLLGAGEICVALRMDYESTQIASDGILDRYRNDDFMTLDGLVTEPVVEQTAAESPSRNAYYVDGETLRAVVDVRIGVARRFEAGLELPLLLHTAGFLDPIIDSFHNSLGLPDGGRKWFADGQSVVAYADQGDILYVDDAQGGIRPGDLSLSGRGTIAQRRDGRASLAGSVILKLPTGGTDRLDGSGSVDLGAGVQASWRLDRSTWHAGYQYSRLGRWDLEPSTSLRDRQSLSGAYVFRRNEKAAIIVQILGTFGPFPHRDDGDLGEPALELAAGMRHAAPHHLQLEWALLESVSNPLNIPDVGVHFGMTYARPPGGR